jgi:hypothetical protein
VGLVEPAAAAGPRFRPGSAVWVAPQAEGEAPMKGTVGQMVSANGGAGGQALYKVINQQVLRPGHCTHSRGRGWGRRAPQYL